MRMERINDRQVRCLITAQDLQQRKLMLRELKYGNRETSELFREILNRATTEYGFNEDELPVMIEAVPVSNNELLIILSAVEDAEELDPHFAHFAEPPVETNDGTDQESFLDQKGNERPAPVCLVRFNTIDECMDFCRLVSNSFPGESRLYKTEEYGLLLALIRPDSMSGEDFLVFLNGVLEYADLVEGSPLIYAYLNEHVQPVMEDPLHKLA